MHAEVGLKPTKMVAANPGETVDGLLRRWGAWRNSDIHDDGQRHRSTMYTPGNAETRRSYWQPCQICYATGADLSAVGTGIKTRAALIALANNPDKDKRRRCPKCRGRCGRYEQTPLADPAAIPSTGPGGMYVAVQDTPEVYADIEAALTGMDDGCRSRGMGPRHRAVIEARYIHFPRTRATQNTKEFGQKARVAWVNGRIFPDSISGPRFGQILGETRNRLAEIFGIPVWDES